jgi:hypothetical protein
MALAAISAFNRGAYVPMNRVQQRITEMGAQLAAKVASQDNAYMTVSNFGNQTYLGTSTFQKDNRSVINAGGQQTGQIASVGNGYYDISSGQSYFQKDNDRTYSIGTAGTSRIADVGKSYYEVSNFGSKASMGQGTFSNWNHKVSQWGEDSMSAAMQQARNAYNTAMKSSSRGILLDISA